MVDIIQHEYTRELKRVFAMTQLLMFLMKRVANASNRF
jgi:hypothetical protein